MHDISIWCLDLTRIALAPMRALLSAGEQARASQYQVRGEYERFVKSRGALRRILAEQAGQTARALVLAEGNGRKPKLRDHPLIRFNLSHSGDFTLIAVAAQPLGVDIEAIKADIGWRDLAEANFHRDERAVLEASADAAARDAFFQIWTHKEAFLKATGVGLTDHLTAICIPLEGGPVRAPDSLSSETWHATPLEAPRGYKASLVTRSAHVALRDLTSSFSD
jgi:4'-phosphopantetheinyl transferase